MAHLIDSMAYTGQTPWHGLGNVLPPQQSLDVWLQAAGMDWTIEQSDVLYQGSPDNPILHTYPDSKVLYRSDTLGCVLKMLVFCPPIVPVSNEGRRPA
ncbi:hypothetical protein [Aeromonas salmonicida]|uniref:hypothetical protein n=1 Tax=Aeromonas salmonicida TaxID=645 RepID=UPI00073C8E60|nr:hypothetical protein [Aeromonas salmonicida]KTA79461.1 hypothetical protein VO70_20355 [Aeromonas salmonicida]